MILTMANAVLIMDGITMPTPKYNGFKISKNKIWSKNTGRNDYGDMVGNIIKIKRKVEITFPPLTPAQTALLDSVVSSTTSYHTLSYTDEAGNITTMTVYFNDPVYPILGTNIHGKQINDGVGVNAIEQ